MSPLVWESSSIFTVVPVYGIGPLGGWPMNCEPYGKHNLASAILGIINRMVPRLLKMEKANVGIGWKVLAWKVGIILILKIHVGQVCVCSTKAVCNSANKTKANSKAKAEDDSNGWMKTSKTGAGSERELKTVLQFYSNSSQVNHRWVLGTDGSAEVGCSLLITAVLGSSPSEFLSTKKFINKFSALASMDQVA